MIQVSVHVVMGKSVVSIRCVDIASGHDHCLWSGGRLFTGLDAGSQLEALADATRYVADRFHRDELDECTSDCLQ
jgi:hypothetical protein